MKHYLGIFLLILGVAGWLGVNGFHSVAWASPGKEVFQGFMNHIGIQIEIDKEEFAIADTCMAWFYKQMGQKPRPEVERIHFSPTRQRDQHAKCGRLFPEGLKQVRQAFGDTQQRLSLSLTFFQMALVGDGDDNYEYSAVEIHDVLDAFGLPFQEEKPLGNYMIVLTGLFDTIRQEGQFQFLMEGMQALMNKGYRFTGADQEVLNQQLSGSQRRE